MTDILTGKCLLEKLKTLSHLSHSDRAKECGYYTVVLTQGVRNKIRINLSDFYNAILSARKLERTRSITSKQPNKYDAVLGGQTKSPTQSVVLGGLEGIKHRLQSKSAKVRITALTEALNYEVGLDLVINALQDPSKRVQGFAGRTLRKMNNPKAKEVLLNCEPWKLFITLEHWKVENFDLQTGINNPFETAYAVNSEQFTSLLQDDKASKLQALIYRISSDRNNQHYYAIDTLFDAREHLINLKALRIEPDETSVGDISAILKVYPKLEVLQIRGGVNVDFSIMQHNNLKTLIIDTAQFTNEAIHRLCGVELPALEYLDLWCSNGYHRYKSNLNILMPILSGQLFPQLKYLGIHTTNNYDGLAEAIVRSPIVKRLMVLDISSGTMQDKDAEALLNCPFINKMHTLNISRNYLTSRIIKKFSQRKHRVITEPQLNYRYSSLCE